MFQQLKEKSGEWLGGLVLERVRQALAPWKPVLVLEWVAWVFGYSWFRKGQEFDREAATGHRVRAATVKASRGYNHRGSWPCNPALVWAHMRSSPPSVPGGRVRCTKPATPASIASWRSKSFPSALWG